MMYGAMVAGGLKITMEEDVGIHPPTLTGRLIPPKGWRLVPYEVTDAMVTAWEDAKPSSGTYTDRECATADYQAMLDAAPDYGALI